MGVTLLTGNCNEPVRTIVCPSVTPCQRCEFLNPVPVLIATAPGMRFSVRRTKRPIPQLPPKPTLSHDEELKRLADTVKALRISDWYRPGLDWHGAKKLLENTSPGAFVVRDSGDKNFIFSLSVQTERGPTSVRLHYEHGKFRLDSEARVVWAMPTFSSVVELVQYYVSASNSKTSELTIWVDSKGTRHSSVYLKAGLREKPASLMHLSRLAIHKAIAANKFAPQISTAPRYRCLKLPPSLIDYLGQYPYFC